jgi:hypothetical protein
MAYTGYKGDWLARRQEAEVDAKEEEVDVKQGQ